MGKKRQRMEKMSSENLDFLLVVPPMAQNNYCMPREKNRQAYAKLTRIPQGLFSIANHLMSRGLKGRIFDSRKYIWNNTVDKEFQIAVTKEIKEGGIVGFYTISGIGEEDLRGGFYHLGDATKYVRSDVLRVMGGPFASMYPQACLEHCDVTVKGDGEEPLESICKNGVRDGTVTAESERPYDVKSQQYPLNYDCLDIEFYLEGNCFRDHKFVRALQYSSSRGCPYRCTFCCNSTNVIPHNKKYRYKNAEQMFRDVTYMVEEFSLEHVFIEEEDPFCSIQRMLDFSEKMKELGVTWYANIRVDEVIRHKQHLSKFVDAGWADTSLGFEAASDRLLKLLGKKITVRDILESAKILNDVGVFPLWSGMWQLPTETEQEAMLMVTLIERLKELTPECEVIAPQPYRPYQGTALYEKFGGNRGWGQKMSMCEVR